LFADEGSRISDEFLLLVDEVENISEKFIFFADDG
jgi:hypothetical protein